MRSLVGVLRSCNAKNIATASVANGTFDANAFTLAQNAGSEILIAIFIEALC